VDLDPTLRVGTAPYTLHLAFYVIVRRVGQVPVHLTSNILRWVCRYHDKCHGGEIYQSIEALDRQGMQIIEAQDAKAFAQYQRDFGNTICGRHAIAVLLNAIAALPPPKRFSLKFVRYEQSSRCRTPDDSSVSYATAVACPSCTGWPTPTPAERCLPLSKERVT